MEEGASLTLIQRCEPAARRNAALEIVLGPDAVLNHVRLAPTAPDAVLVEEAALRLDRGARYQAHFAAFGGRLMRPSPAGFATVTQG